MVNTSSETKVGLRYAISYDLAGGLVHAREINKLLCQSGYEAAVTMDEADIIIAHLAGCWLIPESAKPKMVLYVSMPLAQDWAFISLPGLHDDIWEYSEYYVPIINYYAELLA